MTDIPRQPSKTHEHRIAKAFSQIPSEVANILMSDTTAQTLQLIQNEKNPNPAWVKNRIQNMLVMQQATLQSLNDLLQRATALHKKYQSIAGDDSTTLSAQRVVLASLQLQINKNADNIKNLQQLKQNIQIVQAQQNAIMTMENLRLLTQLKTNLQKGGNTTT